MNYGLTLVELWQRNGDTSSQHVQDIRSADIVDNVEFEAADGTHLRLPTRSLVPDEGGRSLPLKLKIDCRPSAD